MKYVILIALLALAIYLTYQAGMLNRLLPGLPDPNATPQMAVTVGPPSRADGTPGPSGPQTTVEVAPPVALDASTPTPTALPAQATLPPPTIVVPETPPTLAVSTTPTPASVFPLTIETPQDGETVSASPWLVVGQTQPDALVSVNDTVGFADGEGRFSLPVPLQPGVNVLEVVASNAAGETTHVILTVLYQF